MAKHDIDAEVSPSLRMDGIRIATLIVLGLISVVVILQSIYLFTAVREQRETNECYQQQLTVLLDSYTTAREAAKQDRQSQRELLLAQAGPDADGQAAIHRFLAQLDEADRARSENPPPAAGCGP